MVKIGSDQHWAEAGKEDSPQYDAALYAVNTLDSVQINSNEEYASRLLDALEAIGWRLIHV